MTADEFVAAIKQAAAGFCQPRTDDRWYREREAAVCARAAIAPRKAPGFEHPADPVLDLLARYDLSGVKLWQFKFWDLISPDGDSLWHVTQKSTDDYYIVGGSILKMYYKEAFPGATGLSSGQFLEVIALYARLIAAIPTAGEADPVLAESAKLAVAISPDASGLDWFVERRAEFAKPKRGMA
jgi:hypothetical protein